ncbi:ABC transporter permease [Candidatus Aciduliprofundum boonei]|uniref:Binding-protein-dependent transport systems inner membrane component n=1 Tax=Aciduliprofundum boonei (strain DSM 19572 / T469) TaxID=439481 RepID=B5ID23_ACIB4|nr:ABC transporter permease [Candidatus Aciduliprofundum boonei]ADD09211.1 binding-protein-dependent transport systems inner membrane component [Aciduliprofundum boonei T469]EDY35859.1 ABC transporter, permease protein [Aciduliprofundum boonei T469]HII55825.1 ABC transporter permease [Candidatus Aciduliprofundum boonei]
MRSYVFPALIILLTAVFFGSYAFVTVSIAIFVLIFLKDRNKKYLIFLFLAFMAFIHPLLGIVPIIYLLLIMERDNFYRIAYILGSLFLVFIIFPILNLLLYFSPQSIYDKSLINAITVSFVAATSSTVIGLIFALPIGYVLARRNFIGKSIVESIIDLPIVVPHTVAGIILLLVFGTSGIWGAPLEEIGIRFYYAMPGIIVAMLFVSAPFLINQVREGIKKIDERYEYTAMSLGAGRFRTFMEIILPQIKGNILTGSVNSWARAISEFGAVMMIAFYPMVAPTYIYFLYTNYGLKAALPATAFLLLITLVVFIFLKIIAERMKNA